MQISAQPLAYSDLDTPLTGMLYRNEALPGRRPGILLVHGGAGLDEHAREQARRYAALGYVVHACDMLGEGAAGDRERVIQCLTALRDDPALLVRRGRAGLAALSGCPDADGRFAAIGFCFGGLAVLALARAGEKLAGVASIHGSLAARLPWRPGPARSPRRRCSWAVACHCSAPARWISGVSRPSRAKAPCTCVMKSDRAGAPGRATGPRGAALSPGRAGHPCAPAPPSTG